MENQKIENIEAIACILIASINGIILSTSQALIDTTGSSSLISVIYITLITIILTLILCILSKQFLGQNLFDITEYLGGKTLKFIVGILFVFYLIYRAFILVQKMSRCMQIVYFPMTNVIFIISLFCIASGFVATQKNNSIFKSIVLVTPIVFSLSILVFIGNSKNFHYENIYPILGNSVKSTFLESIGNLFCFSGMFYLFFFPSKLKHPEKITKIAIISIILSSIFLFFSVANIMLLFSDVMSNSSTFPLYVSVRYIEFGSFFQRLDAVFLFLCVFGFVCILTLNAYFAIDILKNISSLSDSKPLIFAYLLFVFGIAEMIKQNSILDFLSNSVSKILFIVFAIIIPFIILLCANIKKFLGGTK